MKPEVCMIVAMTEGGLIGKGGGLPWKCSADMSHFKNTTAHYPVVVGPNTALGMPRFPLSGRPGAILSKKVFGDFGGQPLVIKTIADKKSFDYAQSNRQYLMARYSALYSAPSFILYDIGDIQNTFSNYEKVFIAGGAGVYKSALKSDVIDTIYKTVFPNGFCGGDKYLDDDTREMMSTPNFKMIDSTKYELPGGNLFEGPTHYYLADFDSPMHSGQMDALKPTDTPFPWIRFEVWKRAQKNR